MGGMRTEIPGASARQGAVANLPALPRLPRAADLEIGDTAGLETCATSGRRMLGGSADFQVCCVAGFQSR